jgi:dTDP-4-dehydrorhamnose reductase
MAQRVLILGSTGMLGHILHNTLQNSKIYEIFDISKNIQRNKNTIICDVTNFENLSKIIIRLKPSIVVNCVGILIRGSKESPLNAIIVNSALPNFLLNLGQKNQFKLIHISTDCVFSGQNGPYDEFSPKDAYDIYGQSKSLGEVNSSSTLTIRTSIIGPELKEHGEGLLHWFLTVREEQIQGYSNVFWSGVTTLECAKAIDFAIRENITGIWNLTNGIPISKFEILSIFNETSKLMQKKVILNDNIKFSNKTLISRRSDIVYHVPNYLEMFDHLFQYINQNKEDYKHYFSSQTKF